jgi:chemotaxis protein MotB
MRRSPASARFASLLLVLLRRLAAVVPVALLVAALAALAGCGGSEEMTVNTPPPEADCEAETAPLRERITELEAELERARMNARRMRRGETVEVLSTDLYFESGSAKLAPEGVDKLAEVAQRIRSTYAGRALRVEGYTDSNPIGDRLKRTYPSNWELSAARAAAVVRHLRWTHEIEPERFEVVGYGPFQPVATNDTAEGRRENRRVRIAVLPPAISDVLR